MSDSTDLEKSTTSIQTNSGTARIGVWLGKPKPSCRVCQSELAEEVHRKRHEGLSLRSLEDYLKENHGFLVSHPTLSRHFRYHYMVFDNNEVIMAGKDPSDIVQTSIDTMFSEINNNKATFYESVSYLVKSKLEQLKHYQDVADELEESLHEHSPDGKSGFSSTDRDSDTKIQRWTYFQKEINSLKNELNSTYLDMQKIQHKNESESIKNHIFMLKNFLIKYLIQEFVNLLVDAKNDGLVTSEGASTELGKRITDVLKKFEKQMSVDFLYQQAVQQGSSEEKEV